MSSNSFIIALILLGSTIALVAVAGGQYNLGRRISSLEYQAAIKTNAKPTEIVASPSATLAPTSQPSRYYFVPKVQVSPKLTK